MRRKLLLVVYDFPPEFGGGNVMRAVKFAKFLPQFEWMPIILTVQRSDVSVKDKSLMDDIQQAKIYKCKDPIFPTMRKLYQKYCRDKQISEHSLKNRKHYSSIWRSLKSWGKMLSLQLIGHSGWYFPALRKGRSIIKKENVSAVMSTSPPHTPHLVALKLSKEFGIPWVADFRDRWSDNPIFKGPIKFQQGLDHFLEKKIVNNCSCLTCVNDRISSYFRKKYNEAGILTLWNGYDEDDFKGVIPIQHKKFTITYVGRVRGVNRQFNCFLDALEEVNQELKDDLQVLIVGNITANTEADMRERTRNGKAKNNIQFIGEVSHREAIRFMLSSDVLLNVLLQEEDAYYVTTGKVFEYLRAGKPILAICPKRSGLSELVSSWNSKNICVDPKNVELITQEIENLYEKWCQGKLQFKNKNSQMLQNWTRRKQTSLLAKGLDKITLKGCDVRK